MDTRTIQHQQNRTLLLKLNSPALQVWLRFSFVKNLLGEKSMVRPFPRETVNEYFNAHDLKVKLQPLMSKLVYNFNNFNA